MPGKLPLDEPRFARAVRALCRADPDLRAIVGRHGRPDFFRRDPGFASLVRIILEQQVSLASAAAAFHRLVHAIHPLTPSRVLAAGERRLRGAGLTRQKAAYTIGLAGAIASGRLDLDRLTGLDDDEARGALMELKGIGRWTADIYLLAALRRPDVWPTGDMALAAAVEKVKRLRSRPTPEKLERRGDGWRPYRAVAARLLWHEYLAGRAPVTD